MQDIDQFLEQRISEDERHARAAMALLPLADSRLILTADGRVAATGSRLLAETALKRDMLFSHYEWLPETRRDVMSECPLCQEPFPCQSLRIAAAVYRDHPNYEQIWKPTEPDTRAD